ncbi:hypothetical protein BC567DRAFT_47710 [Phyllosticta citribraziliensis]
MMDEAHNKYTNWRKPQLAKSRRTTRRRVECGQSERGRNKQALKRMALGTTPNLTPQPSPNPSSNPPQPCQSLPSDAVSCQPCRYPTGPRLPRPAEAASQRNGPITKTKTQDKPTSSLAAHQIATIQTDWFWLKHGLHLSNLLHSWRSSSHHHFRPAANARCFRWVPCHASCFSHLLS